MNWSEKEWEGHYGTQTLFTKFRLIKMRVYSTTVNVIKKKEQTYFIFEKGHDDFLNHRKEGIENHRKK